MSRTSFKFILSLYPPYTLKRLPVIGFAPRRDDPMGCHGPGVGRPPQRYCFYRTVLNLAAHHPGHRQERCCFAGTTPLDPSP